MGRALLCFAVSFTSELGQHFVCFVHVKALAEISRLVRMTLLVDARMRMRCQALLAMASREDGRKYWRFSIPSLEEIVWKKIQEQMIIICLRD